MTKDEIEKLDQDLAKEQATIEGELSDIATQAPGVKGDFNVKVDDFGTSQEDAGQEAAELDRNQAMVDELERRLKDIIHTREKIKNGNYGQCEKCSANIPVARLKVMPVAVMCISCAEKNDL